MSSLNRRRDLTLVVGTASTIFSATTPGHQRSDIHYAGCDDDLAALYEAALCLAFPSKTKGFGIPPLEAMAGGRPVISLNAASLVEVGGDAVAYVDPDHGDGWRDAIIGLAGNLDLRTAMATRGVNESRAVFLETKRAALPR